VKVQNIRLIIEYEGTNYSGWQIQTRQASKTIQGVLEEALTTISRRRIRVIGAGRTDAGVHALGQVANFKTGSKMDPEEFQKALNKALPRDIVIRKTERAKEDFHAQFAARGKYYRYIIYQGPTRSPLLDNYSCYVSFKLNMRAMREAAKYLVGKHDFSSFKLSGSSVRSPVRTVTKLAISSYRGSGFSFGFAGLGKDSSVIFIDAIADGFLYGMVRSLAGTLIEVGKGKISPSRVKEILAARDRRQAGPTAPARGLYLVKVKY
jgi:tRNA pseudouridine38-40 synthase